MNSLGETISEEKARILAQIQATFDYMPDDRAGCEELRAWLLWQLRNFLDKVGPEDLFIGEIMALVGALGPAFSRLLPSVGSGPAEATTSLRVV